MREALLFCGLLTAMMAQAASVVTRMIPECGARGVNPDTHLTLVLSEDVRIGQTGFISIYDKQTGELVDRLDMSIPAGPTQGQPNNPAAQYTPIPYVYQSKKITNRNTKPGTPSGVNAWDNSRYQLDIIGGFSDAFHFYPIIAHGNQATIFLHHNMLDYGHEYYVTVDKGVIEGFDGIKGKKAWTFRTKDFTPAPTQRRLVVAADGSGDFSTVQGAMDFIPDSLASEAERYEVYIKNGDYEELVYFRNKRFVTIEGESREGVLIHYPNNEVFNPHPADIKTNEVKGTFPSRRAAFAADNCSDLIMKNITLKTDCKGQAEGLLVNGERNFFENVHIIGDGDALQANGSCYWLNCRIDGGGDTILGRGPSFFNHCTITSYGAFMWIRNTEENHGNIFVDCQLKGLSKYAVLGRLPNNKGKNYPHAECVLLNCELDSIPAEGWGEVAPEASTATLLEFNSHTPEGQAIDISKRHSLLRQLDPICDAALISQYHNIQWVLNWPTPSAKRLPFLVDGVIDTTNYETAGLEPTPGIKTVTIFKAGEQTDHYANGVVMTAFKGKLYCMWQSSPKDEDSDDTWVAYSISSDDGMTWSKPQPLAVPTKDFYCTSGGWLVRGDTLIAFIDTWQKGLEPRGGKTNYITSIDGLTWSQMQPVRMADGNVMEGVLEQDPYTLPDGRLVGASHFMPGLHLCPVYTDDPRGISGWQKGRFEGVDCGKTSREIEPSQFVQPDGTIVMLFRDQTSSFQKLASVSSDRGETWTNPALTNFPDGRTKQCAGNLPTSAAYMVSCPANGKRRWPLVLQLSYDGRVFDRAILLRSGSADNLPPRRYEGRYKTLGYSYPKATIWKDQLYISYSTNKEDVECTIVPLTLLVKPSFKNLMRETSPEFFQTDEARLVGDQILLYQRVTGGWPKNIDMGKPLSDRERALVLADKQKRDDSTTDNGATTSQITFLARLYQQTKDERFRDGFRQGVEYLLSGQYENGGWPQFWPEMRDYQIHITYNDDAIVNTMTLLRDMAEQKEPYQGDLTDEALRQRMQTAFNKGIECILATQIVADGELTVWCQQHDRETLKPAKARAYELPSYCSQESAAITLLLMQLPNPDERVKRAVHAAMRWFEKHKITGYKVVRTGTRGCSDYDTRLEKDPDAQPIWARFYDLEHGEPFVCDRDGIPRRHLSEIGSERRNGYGWYNSRPAMLFPIYEKWTSMHK